VIFSTRGTTDIIKFRTMHDVFREIRASRLYDEGDDSRWWRRWNSQWRTPKWGSVTS